MRQNPMLAENDELDEIDKVESSCYTTLQDAEQKLNTMKESFCRKNCVLLNTRLMNATGKKDLLKNITKPSFSGYKSHPPKRKTNSSSAVFCVKKTSLCGCTIWIPASIFYRKFSFSTARRISAEK